MSETLLVLLSIAAVDLAGAASPGPAFLGITRTAAAGGRGAGLRFGLGLACGSAIWAGAALFGLSAVFAAAPWLEGALKLAGAAYLLYLAVTLWRRAARGADIRAEAAPKSPFRSAVLLQMANPKTAVFFGSIFITVAPADPTPAMSAMIAGTVALTEILWFSTLALAFGSEAVQRRYARVGATVDRICGAAMTALAARMAWS